MQLKQNIHFLKYGKEIIKKLNIINAAANVPANKTITFIIIKLFEKEIIPLKFSYVKNNKFDWLANRLLNSYNIYLKKRKKFKIHF